MLTNEAQKQTARNIEARGYYEGWTPNQLISRQVAKLQEELAEIAQTVDLPPALLEAILDAGVIAKIHFDNRECWTVYSEPNYDELRKETTDAQVVVYQMAHMIELGTEHGYDAGVEAVRKSAADIQRGVRSNDPGHDRA